MLSAQIVPHFSGLSCQRVRFTEETALQKRRFKSGRFFAEVGALNIRMVSPSRPEGALAGLSYILGGDFMRLFIAIELPDDLKAALGGLRVDVPGARWVPPEQLHLTLAFLGEVEEKTAGELGERLALIHTPPFQLCFSGTGCFPNRHRPRVLWAGLEPHPLLMNLAAGVHGAVLACSIPQEERPFSPHITLARLKFPAAREVDAFLNMPQKLKLPPFPVREITLFQSRLTPHGAVHIPVRTFPTEGAGDGADSKTHATP